VSEISQYDQVQHFWCPVLGQTITFGYCRRTAEGLPCHRVVTCFSPHFAVEAFLAEHYTPAEQERFLAPPKGRLQRVLDALAQAQAQQKKDDPS